MGEHPSEIFSWQDGPAAAAAEARVREARAFYHDAVAAYLGAVTEQEREFAGEAMYFAQMATIEARFNAEGSARFRALAEAKIPAPAEPAASLAVAA